MTCGTNPIYQVAYDQSGCCGSTPTYIEVPVQQPAQPNIFESNYSYSPTTENNQQYTTNNNQQYITNNDYTKKYYTSIFNTNNYHTVNNYPAPKKVGLNGVAQDTCKNTSSIFNSLRNCHQVTTRPQERHAAYQKPQRQPQVHKPSTQGNWVGRAAQGFLGGLFGNLFSRNSGTVARDNYNNTGKHYNTKHNNDYKYHSYGKNEVASNYGNGNNNYFLNNNNGFINFVDA